MTDWSCEVLPGAEAHIMGTRPKVASQVSPIVGQLTRLPPLMFLFDRYDFAHSRTDSRR